MAASKAATPATPTRPVHPVRRARGTRGLRQADLARLVGCEISLVSMVEAGYIPAPSLMVRFATALATPCEALWPDCIWPDPDQEACDGA